MNIPFEFSNASSGIFPSFDAYKGFVIQDLDWSEGLPPTLSAEADNALIVAVNAPPFKEIRQSMAFKRLSAREQRQLSNYSEEKIRRHKIMAQLLRNTLEATFPLSSWRQSTSHSGQWVVVALSSSAAGVDVQAISFPEHYPLIAAKLFPPLWQKMLMALEKESTRAPLFFTSCWTALEAQFKLEQGATLLPFLKEIAQEEEVWERFEQLDHFQLDEKHLVCLARDKSAPPPLLYRVQAESVLNAE